MQFENISIHCENRHIVESCEITATVAPSADEVVMLQIVLIRYVMFYVFYLSMLIYGRCCSLLGCLKRIFNNLLY